MYILLWVQGYNILQLTLTRPEKQIRRKTIVGVPGEVREVLSKDAKDKLWRMLKRSQKSCCKSLAIWSHTVVDIVISRHALGFFGHYVLWEMLPHLEIRSSYEKTGLTYTSTFTLTDDFYCVAPPHFKTICGIASLDQSYYYFLCDSIFAAWLQHIPTAVGTVGTVATGFVTDVTGQAGGNGHTVAFCGDGSRFRGFRGFCGYCVPSWGHVATMGKRW